VSFQLLMSCPATGARAGLLNTSHGQIATLGFMPVGTLATVKSLTPLDLAQVGAQCVVATTYHLMLRAGAALVGGLGGLHRTMGWDRPILADSDGFQVRGLVSTAERTRTAILDRSFAALAVRAEAVLSESSETERASGAHARVPLGGLSCA
jgi:queuine tRNA-ribosyltransferase